MNMNPLKTKWQPAGGVQNDDFHWWYLFI